MTFIEIFMLAVGLAMDSFSVSLGAGASGYAMDPRSAVRLAFHLGLFQFLMPIVGWCLGNSVAQLIASFDHWIAFLLLLFVGGRMIRDGFQDGATPFAANPSRGFTLVLLSVATSIDALAIGLSLAMLGISIWYPSVVIGVVTGMISLGGVPLGAKLGHKLGKRAGIVGGLILFFIGLRILITHLLA
ncbi:MAG TPA: manganese efflux pump [Anaerolineae bacterium]|nr:manganese efflux pump [Anaerolineae bacterium]